METLNSLGFIWISPKGNKKFGYVLIRNPLLVAVELHHSDKRVKKYWWNAFIGRAQEIGADIEHAEALFQAKASESK